MTQIDQIKTRRLVRTGVTAYNKALACPGYVLFTPLFGLTTYLMALDGTMVHEWQHEYVPGLYGIYRTHDWLTHSKVLEINPQTNQVEWEYADEPVWDFYSPTVSGAQRLANGNTLITEGTTGLLFQVTRDGQIVWEYVNPFFHVNTRNWEVNMIFRATHYMGNALPQL